MRKILLAVLAIIASIFTFGAVGVFAVENQSAENFEIISISKPSIEDENFNFSVEFSKNLASEEISNAHEQSWLKGFIKFNGETLENINSSQTLISATANEKTILFIVAESLIKKDNADCFEISANFLAPSGESLSAGFIKYYNHTVADWVDEIIDSQLSGESVSISSVSAFSSVENNPSFTIYFDKNVTYKYLPHYNGATDWHEQGATEHLGITSSDIAKMKIQPAHSAILNGVSINGKTIGEIMQSTATNSNVAIMAHYNHNYLILAWDGSNSQTVVDFTKDVTLQIDKDIFVTPNGAKLNESVNLTYKNQYTAWFDGGEIPQVEKTKIERLDFFLYMEAVDAYAVQIHFKHDAAFAGVENVQNAEFLQKNFKINGKTIGEINQNAKDADGKTIQTPIIAHLLPPTGVAGEGKVVLHLFINAKIAQEYGGIKPSGNTIEVLKDALLPSLKKVDRDYKFEYDGGWGEVKDTSDIVWEEVKLIRVSKPITGAENNVGFTLTFDKAITNNELLHINADVSWLLAVSAQDTPPFRYSAEELNILTAYGILKSLKNNVLFNGLSIKEMMEKETVLAYRHVTVMVHIGHGGLYVGGTSHTLFRARNKHRFMRLASSSTRFRKFARRCRRFSSMGTASNNS